jgi:hypothetical protein
MKRRKENTTPKTVCMHSHTPKCIHAETTPEHIPAVFAPPIFFVVSIVGCQAEGHKSSNAVNIKVLVHQLDSKEK